LTGVDTTLWAGLSIKDWWVMMAAGSLPNRKAMSSLTLLLTWEIWCERNAKVFHNKQALAHVVFDRIRREARLWVLAGAKAFGRIDAGRVIRVSINIVSAL
jgi:hypothetical protein